jgi:hypothetical protein
MVEKSGFLVKTQELLNLFRTVKNFLFKFRIFGETIDQNYHHNLSHRPPICGPNWNQNSKKNRFLTIFPKVFDRKWPKL